MLHLLRDLAAKAEQDTLTLLLHFAEEPRCEVDQFLSFLKQPLVRLQVIHTTHIRTLKRSPGHHRKPVTASTSMLFRRLHRVVLVSAMWGVLCDK